MKFLNTRTILTICILLSSIAVIKQNINTQISVMITATMLVILHSERAMLFEKLLGKFKHLWIAILSIAVIQIIFRREGNILLSFNFLKITDIGLFYGITVSLRLTNLILISGLLFSISSTDYMLAFKAWHFPFEISFLITSVIRFIPDYYKLFLAYRETLYLRNIDLKRLTIRNKLLAIVSLLMPVLTTNLAEVKSRAIALDLKGFRLFKKRTYLYESKLKIQDYIFQVVAIMIFLIMLTR